MALLHRDGKPASNWLDGFLFWVRDSHGNATATFGPDKEGRVQPVVIALREANRFTVVDGQRVVQIMEPFPTPLPPGRIFRLLSPVESMVS